MSELNKLVDEYILANPKQPNQVGYYKEIAAKFNIHPEKARKRWRQLQKYTKPKFATEDNWTYASSVNEVPRTIGYYHVDGTPTPTTTVSHNSNTGDYTYTVDATEEKVENLDDLVKVAKINLDKGNILDYEIKSYNAWIKNSQGEIESKPLYSVKAKVKNKKESTVEFDKQLFLDEIKKHSPRTVRFRSVENTKESLNPKHALEINIPDLHIGKLAWGKETGEDYDIKIAVDRYKLAVDELLSRVNLSTVAKIILPVGNDLINVDNAGNTTTAGTAVSCDSRFGKMFQTAKELLIETIDKLVQIAEVDVIIIPGNHDTISTFTLGEVLHAWYHNTPQVNVINTHTPRKYYQYGQNLIMYTHGHREKLESLGYICATEQPQLWAATKYRRVHVGHFHHSKQIKFVDVQEYPGFTVKILNSLSANDAWHAEKGYLSLKGAEAFLYHFDKGLVANYYYIHS